MDDLYINTLKDYTQLIKLKSPKLTNEHCNESFKILLHRTERYLANINVQSVMFDIANTRKCLQKLEASLQATNSALRNLNTPSKQLLKSHGFRQIDLSKNLTEAVSAVICSSNEIMDKPNKVANYELTILIKFLRDHLNQLLEPYSKKATKTLATNVFTMITVLALNRINKRRSLGNQLKYKIPYDIGRQYDSSKSLDNLFDD